MKEQRVVTLDEERYWAVARSAVLPVHLAVERMRERRRKIDDDHTNEEGHDEDRVLDGE